MAGLGDPGGSCAGRWPAPGCSPRPGGAGGSPPGCAGAALPPRTPRPHPGSPPRRAAAARTSSVRGAGNLGSTTVPSGRSSPVSSKTMTPLHSSDQPCSGRAQTTRAAARSRLEAAGHRGWWGHRGARCCLPIRSASPAVRWRAPARSFRRAWRANRAANTPNICVRCIYLNTLACLSSPPALIERRRRTTQRVHQQTRSRR
jgi:hypothetical protein